MRWCGIGEYVADNGLTAMDLIRQHAISCSERARVSAGSRCMLEGETTVEAAVRLCAHLTGGVLPIQGPPGAGKTFTGARMICELVRHGKKVGITANSHKVIRNLIDAAIKAADELRDRAAMLPEGRRGRRPAAPPFLC